MRGREYNPGKTILACIMVHETNLHAYYALINTVYNACSSINAIITECYFNKSFC